jgi:hypothetical protein
MKILFNGMNNPRDGYNLGPHKCSKCGSKPSALLKVSMWKKNILLCKKCLGEGEDIINKTILSQCLDK